ncbi:MAG: DNA-binding protein [Sphingomonas sp.]
MSGVHRHQSSGIERPRIEVLGAESKPLPADPISVRIAMAVRLTGISRSRLYELIQAGDLETVKIGRSTLVLFRSLKRLVEG